VLTHLVLISAPVKWDLLEMGQAVPILMNVVKKLYIVIAALFAQTHMGLSFVPVNQDLLVTGVTV